MFDIVIVQKSHLRFKLAGMWTMFYLRSVYSRILFVTETTGILVHFRRRGHKGFKIIVSDYAIVDQVPTSLKLLYRVLDFLM